MAQISESLSEPAWSEEDDFFFADAPLPIALLEEDEQGEH